MSPEFSEPEESEYKRLAKQWLGVVNLVREEYEIELDQSPESLNKGGSHRTRAHER